MFYSSKLALKDNDVAPYCHCLTWHCVQSSACKSSGTCVWTGSVWCGQAVERTSSSLSHATVVLPCRYEGLTSPYIYPLYGLGELPQVRHMPGRVVSAGMLSQCVGNTALLVDA